MLTSRIGSALVAVPVARMLVSYFVIETQLGTACVKYEIRNMRCVRSSEVVSSRGIHGSLLTRLSVRDTDKWLR